MADPTTANATTTTMNDKVCLVTGATSGLGYVTARELARLGAHVVLISRNPEKLAASAAAIRNETAAPAVDALAADLSSQAEIRRLADEINQKYDRIHVLVNNAGAVFLDRRESPDGIELTFALNHLGPFLLTNLILDRIRAAAPARIINISSDAHTIGKLDFDDLEGKKRYGGMKAYGRSKLANIYFTIELARRLEGTGVTVNAVHPGFVQTNFFAGNGPLGAFFRWANRNFGTPAEKAARTAIHLAAAPELEGATGGYYVKSRPHATARVARDQAAARRLWEISEQMTGLAPAAS